ncbi:MAG: hypothetical protein U5K74_13410 [Gemmatimonadaceae bacterium]|nr:hypothetical protein [Gemmatimonadaceae bacterium]
MRAAIVATLCAGAVVACGGAVDTRPAARLDSVRTPTIAPVVQPRPIALDTATGAVLEFWPLFIAPGRQVDETRRIVEHLQADLTRVEGFESATLLASGDGSSLLLVAAWRDGTAADRAHDALAGWLRVEGDSVRQRRRAGTLTPRVTVRRTIGSAPTLHDSALVLFTRYAMKPGHSFGALAVLADSNLAMRVLQDTAAQGGTTLAAADSGALYMLMQARTATALDTALQPGGSLPFWAPFSEREEQLLAVVATVHHR